jgi:DNA-binding SARP family transcriptional activator
MCALSEGGQNRYHAAVPRSSVAPSQPRSSSRSRSAAHVDVVLLGGFSVLVNGHAIKGFESRKARALLGYLAVNSDAGELTREHLMAMFWPEDGEQVGRQNLRQALYNVRKTLLGAGAPDLIEATAAGVRFAGGAGVTVDARDLLAGLAGSDQGVLSGSVASLEAACQLYRGRFLDGLTVTDSEELEEWIAVQRERIHTLVLQALQTLADYYRERGEFGRALNFARRQVELDPLSEAGQRELMRAYALVGNRSRALAQFEYCKHLLNIELGVEPAGETAKLQQAILREELGVEPGALPPEPSAPVIPLVGRKDAYRRLREQALQALGGSACFALVHGVEGSGKSRLVRSLIHDIASQTGAAVLLAPAIEMRLPQPLAPIHHLAKSATFADAPRPEWLTEAPTELMPPVLAEFLDADGSERPQEPRGKVTPARCGHAAAELIERIESLAPARGGVIVFADDLQWYDPCSLTALDTLLERTENLHFWFVATARLDNESPAGALGRWFPASYRASRWETIMLPELSREDVGQLAGALVVQQDAAHLREFLWSRTGGLPLLVVEWINVLWHHGHLVHAPGDRFSVQRLSAAPEIADGDIRAVSTMRVEALSPSIRRLLTLAAEAGLVFDSELLLRAEGEHPAVLEVALGTLVEQALIRPHHWSWFGSRRQRDLVLFRQGARRGTFTFSYKALREHVMLATGGERRRAMHQRLGQALAEIHAANPARWAARIGWHFLQAGDTAAAGPLLKQGAAFARSLGCGAVADRYEELVGES